MPLKYKQEALDSTYHVVLVFFAFVLFCQLQLVEKFRPNQIVGSLSHYMTEQESLATFWPWLPGTLSSLCDWVINLHSLIMIWAHIFLFKHTFSARKLKFDNESHISPTGLITTRLVFHFGEELHMKYSTMRNIIDDLHMVMVYSTLWCLLLFSCDIPNVVWSRYWLLDYTSAWFLMIIANETTLSTITMICKGTTKIDKYMVQNYQGGSFEWGCPIHKNENE